MQLDRYDDRVRLSRVAGLPVVDTHVARQAGVVSDVLLDVRAARVAVLNVKHADGWIVQRIPAEYIYRIGPHTVLVADSVAVDLGAPSAEEQWFPTRALVGLSVITDGGDHVGHIADAELDDQTLAVKAYLLRDRGRLWRREGRIRPDQVVSVSPELMLIRARSA